MIYRKGYYLDRFIDSLPNYVSDIDKNNVIKDSINVLSISNPKQGIKKMLLVGQVQSGKTNVIVGASALAMDNDYDIVIVFGGVNQLLLSQTFERLKKPFYTDEYNDLVIIDRNSLKQSAEVDSLSNMAAKYNTKFIIITMKESKNVQNLLSFLKNLYMSSKKVLIIDDEADNASINVGIRENKSLIYAQIGNIFSMISIGAYIGVTATPYGNLISKKSEDLYPDYVYALIPSSEYTGLDFFDSIKSTVYEVVENTKQDFSWDKTIYYGVALFLVNSFIMNKITKKEHSHELLINIDLNIKSFVDIRQSVRRFLKKVNARINNINAFYDIHELKIALKKWTDSGDWIKDYEVEFIDYLRYSLKDINQKVMILADEDNFYESKKNGLNIIVGGSLVSRGFTFNNLLVEIILNSPEQKIPADTLLQRARWFGYRRASNRYKYMKIIMSPHIYNSFAEFIALQKCMFEYIEDVNENLKKLDSDTAIQAFSKYEHIIPSNKK